MEQFPDQESRYDPYVQGLFQFSHRAADRKTLDKSQSPAQPPLSDESTPSPSSWQSTPVPAPSSGALSFSLTHANPLSPLRSRDIQALVEIFTHDHLAEIEADIQDYLHRLYPEPCWEVEPYEFLKGYL